MKREIGRDGEMGEGERVRGREEGRGRVIYGEREIG